MDRIEQADKAFIKVRDELHKKSKMQAYRLPWKKSRKFYLEHSKKEAINTLIKEAKEMK